MLPPANITGTRPIALIEAVLPTSAIGDVRLESFNRLNQLAAGQSYQSQVLAQLEDGGFLVRVGDGAAARMNLPAGTQVGDELDLTLVTTQPRPTFLLGQAPDSATASLSNAGRLIDSALQAGLKEGEPAAVIGKTPILPAAGATPQQVAGALQNTLATSGLFYESHVAQWSRGQRSIVELMQEPEAKRGTLADPAAPVESKTSELNRLLTNVRHWIDGDITARTAETPRAEQLNPESMRLINLQLEALEQRRVAWQGELWPGQKLEWDVTEEAPGRDTEGREQQSWQSVVRFDLPTLGTVSATIRLVGEHVQVQVRTPNEDTAASLRAFQGRLADALDAAGSPLDAFSVKQEIGEDGSA